RPEMNIVTKEKCPTCNGTGSIQASIAVTDLLENHLEHLLEKQNEGTISIILHPFLYAYYREGLISRQVKWFMKYKRWIKLVKDSALGVTDCHIINSHGEEIEIN